MSTKALPEPSADQTAEALLNAVRRKGLSCLPWNEASQNLLVRARNAQHWNLNLTLPDLCDNGLLQGLEQWLAPYLQGINSFKALAKLNLVAALEAYIGWEAMQQLNLWLPTHYQVPTDRIFVCVMSYISRLFLRLNCKRCLANQHLLRLLMVKFDWC